MRGCATSRRPAGGRVAGVWQVRGRCVAGAHAPPLGACRGARLPRCLSPEAAEPSSGAPFAEQRGCQPKASATAPQQAASPWVSLRIVSF